MLDLVGQRPVLDQQLLEALRLREHPRTRVLGVAEDARVLLLDAAHEVEPFEGIGEAVRLEDDGDRVGGRILVAGDEVRSQPRRRPVQTVLEYLEPAARGNDLAAQSGELRLAPLEVGLCRGEALLRRANAGTGCADPVGLGRNSRAQIARGRTARG